MPGPSSYHACLCRELEVRAIGYRSKVALPLEYKGSQIANGYVIDLLIRDSLIVEVKSVANLLPIHTAQLMTYLRLTRLSGGLLINFNVPTLPRGIRKNSPLNSFRIFRAAVRVEARRIHHGTTELTEATPVVKPCRLPVVP